MEYNKKVSIIIPTYKRPTTLRRAIDSVLNQTYSNIEVIVVDDNNEGDQYRAETEKLMFEYINNEKVKYIKHIKNMNGSVARNTGIKNSQGTYIGFLDDDDEFISNKIEYQVNLMEELDSTWGACYTGFRKEKNGKILEVSSENREGYLKNEALMRTLYINAGSNLLVRRSVIEEINGFDESFRRNQDLEFLFRILDKYKLAYVNYCGLVVHFDSRITKNTIDDIDKIDKNYIDTFKNYIDELPYKEQKKLYLMINLDKFKILLLRKQIKLLIKHVIDKKINLVILIRYIFYIVNRKITKRCYGFRI